MHGPITIRLLTLFFYVNSQYLFSVWFVCWLLFVYFSYVFVLSLTGLKLLCQQKDLKKIYFYYKLTNPTVQGPSWEANSSSASQNIPRILLNPKVHYRTLNTSPPVPILSQINPAHASPTRFLKIQFNIILTSMSRSFKWPLSISSPPLKLCLHLSRLPYVPHYYNCSN